MTFSQQLPTAPGLYWFKLVENSSVHYCRVWRRPSDNVLCASAESSYKPVDQFARWWSVDFLLEPEK